jgi:hypothetical protein
MYQPSAACELRENTLNYPYMYNHGTYGKEENEKKFDISM